MTVSSIGTAISDGLSALGLGSGGSAGLGGLTTGLTGLGT